MAFGSGAFSENPLGGQRSAPSTGASSDVTVSTAQGQSIAATAAAVTAGDVQAATAQGQTSAGAGAVGISASASTAQGQSSSASALVPVLSDRWRINISANNGNAAFLTVVDLQFREAPGVPQQFSGGAISASSEDIPGVSAGRAVDSDLTTGWNTEYQTLTGWLEYAYPAPVAVASYVIAGLTSVSSQSPKDWTLEFWDGFAWQVADTRTGQTGWNSATQVREYTLGVSGYAALIALVDPLNATTASAQGQKAGATAGGSADLSVSTAQGQSVAALSPTAGDLLSATAQSQSAMGNAAAGVDAGVGSRQGQGATAATAVSVDSAATSAQGQVALASMVVSAGDAVSTAAQGQNAAAVAAVGAGAQAATRQGQSTDALATGAVGANSATIQGQAASAVSEIGVISTADTRQAASTISTVVLLAPGTAIAATTQGQRAAAQAGIAVNADVNSEQGQTVGASATIAVIAAVTSAHSQTSALQGDVQDSIFSDLVATTGQGEQSATGAARVYTSRDGALTAKIRMRSAVSARTDMYLPTAAHIHFRAAVSAKPHVRPAP